MRRVNMPVAWQGWHSMRIGTVSVVDTSLVAVDIPFLGKRARIH